MPRPEQFCHSQRFHICHMLEPTLIINVEALSLAVSNERDTEISLDFEARLIAALIKHSIDSVCQSAQVKGDNR
jgi:hypothetical protein